MAPRQGLAGQVILMLKSQTHNDHKTKPGFNEENVLFIDSIMT
jgi:hypothetical protein